MKEVARKRQERKTKLKDAYDKCEKAEGTEKASPTSEREERLSGDNVELVLVPSARDQSSPSFPLGKKVDYHFTDFLSKVQANIRRLATVYFTQLGSAMFPMEFHSAYNPPIQLSALDFSMTDEAVFQALLYAAALCSTLAEGRRDSSDVTVQMSRSMRLINQRLRDGMGTADGMLGAVSCLAMGEVSTVIVATGTFCN